MWASFRRAASLLASAAAFIVFSLITTLSSRTTGPTVAARHAPASPSIGSYLQLPLSFEPNQGQAGKQVRFLSRGRGYSLLLESDGAVLQLQGEQGASSELRLKLANANPSPDLEGLDGLPGRSSYFIGNDTGRWRTDIPHFARIRCRDVYPGIDLIYYGHQQQLEYDFIVAPGANPGAIRLRFAGARAMEIDGSGDLILQTAAGSLRQHKPVSYQEDGGVRQQVEGSYIIAGGGEIGFQVQAWDRRRPLVIDPVLSYAAVIGDARNVRLAVDAAGNMYLAGTTRSATFPVSPDAVRWVRGAVNRDIAFVAKINPAGTALLYSTFIGGYEFTDVINGIAVDAAGNAYLAGFAGSKDFPVTAGALQTTFAGPGQVGSSFGGDGFVAKLNATGTALLYSTYLGGLGSDFANGIAVDAAGNAYVAGTTGSSNFPVSPDAPQRSISGFSGSGFISKLNPAGSALVWSTFVGRSTRDSSQAVAVDAEGNAYVTGESYPNIYAAKVDKSGKSFAYYKTLSGGGSYSEGLAMAVDAAGNAYLTGQTSANALPVTADAFQKTSGGGYDAFVAKLNQSGGIAYLSYLGGSGNDTGYGLAVDNSGNVYVTGSTDSPNFPVTPGAFQSNPVLNSGLSYYQVAFITKVNVNGTLGYSSLHGLGGDEGRSVVVSQSRQVLFAGSGFALFQPPGVLFLTPTATVQSFNGTFGAFIAKVDEAAASSDLEVTLAPSDRIFANAQVAYVATVRNAGGTGSVGPITLRYNIPSVFIKRAAGDGWNCSDQIYNGQGACTFTGTLAAGETTKVFVEFFAYATSAGTASATITNVGDNNSSNNTATATIQPVSGCLAGNQQKSAPAQGGAFTLPVNLSCPTPWKAVSNSHWITINSGPATGNGTVNYTVAPNTTNKPRVGSLTVEGFTLEVMQDAAAQPVSVSAASYDLRAPLAVESIVAAFGQNLATGTQSADRQPLPTSLAGTTVKIRDVFGHERLAPLFFVSAGQINYLLPSGTALGPATVTITSGDGTVNTSAIQIASCSPSIFTANANGSGVPAALVLRVKADGSQGYEPVADYDPASKTFVARPIDFGPDLGAASDQLFLILFCTGVRYRSSLESTGVTLTGPSAKVVYAGPQGGFAGLDQVNVELPRALPNYGGTSFVRLYVDGLESLPVQIAVKR